MGDFDLTTARRFDGVALKRGMTVRRGEDARPWLITHADAVSVRIESGDPDGDDRAVAVEYVTVAGPRVALDYTDPGTLGHVLAAVREAWRDPDAFLTVVPPLCTRWVAIDGVAKFSGGTEAAALAAAWEGRPK